MVDNQELTALLKEFLATLAAYLRQRGAEAVTAVVVEPVRKAALKLGLGCAGATLLCLGLVFLGIFAVGGLAWLCGGNYLLGYLAAALLALGFGALLLWLMGRRPREVHRRGEDTSGSDGDR